MSQTVWDITVVGIFQDIDGNMFAATEVVSVSLMAKVTVLLLTGTTRTRQGRFFF
jgi:hypothetical protein